ncbi:MAG: tRNA (N(6)-L-threonylcarbamoyladenosine(37)-C(2))-methylthiotransferase MtaB [Ruminococcaceae bacterium]|nr:tRNA (N(6)-L-threonylcarbamoyladenosine(37)-C(2))-methylthiotransferase MtaB [Oscillospiraceae bacterium]
MKIFFHTLGCKVNQYETQAMETLFREMGYEIATESGNCHMVVINTCAVTAESGRKSRQAIRRLKAENPDAVIGVCGCFSQIEPESIKDLADVVFGSGDRRQFVLDMEKAGHEKQFIMNIDAPLKRRKYEELPAGSLEGRTRAMLKIQDGCSNFCTYCIIPYARGPVRSLPPEKCAAEAARLAAEGIREIMITGIEIASYGKDLKTGVTLADAIVAVAEAAPDVRLHLGSLEPRVITDDFCKKLVSVSSICPHFHLSLQSGCDTVLQRMKRKYDTARFYESVELLRKYFPNCGITADLITGFPGETDEEFSETLAFIEMCAFSSMHIFPYSIRPGTVAASMPNQVTKETKHRRARQAAKLAAEMEEAFLNTQIGTVQQVLFETGDGEISIGHSGNYCQVEVSAVDLHNKVKNVQITGSKQGKLLGNIIL